MSVRDRPRLLEKLMADKTCGCRQCRRERDERNPTIPGLPIETGMMILCSLCGNKRCPHATNHRLACTKSNEDNQLGSAYGEPVVVLLESEIIHAGAGSDLMALCGEMKGISGHDQVKLCYVDEQVNCVKCLRKRIEQLKLAK